jgi:hypothetical protein
MWSNHFSLYTSRVTRMDAFFAEWDWLERLNPWGVVYLSLFFSVNGVPEHMCEEVDDRLFLDLMIPVHQGSRRIKVEGRYSGCVFWVHILLYQTFATVSFQRTPSMPYLRTVSIVATPAAIVASILAFHRWDTGSRMGCRRSKSTWRVKRAE